MQIIKPILLGLFFFDFVNAGFLSTQMVLHSDFENGNGILPNNQKQETACLLCRWQKIKTPKQSGFIFGLPDLGRIPF
jgi:hypothetical protein